MELKPILKWAGGKRQLLPEIIKRMPEKYNWYHQPFFGGGTPAWYFQPKKAVFSDLNEELVNLYKVIREVPEALINELKSGLYQNTKERYYRIRGLDQLPDFNDPVKRAARTIYLNKTCFNGMYRVNKKGWFNTPFGYYKQDPDWNFDLILRLSAYLSGEGIFLFSGDFKEHTSMIHENDFVFLDPPYSPASKTANFTQYTEQGFSENDQICLYQWVQYLTENKVKCMICNSNNLFINKLWTRNSLYKLEPVEAIRAISSKAENRGPSFCEVIITNY